jgi:hypothetical protein
VAPPEGYTPFFVETIGRHGSMAATSSGEESRMIRIWEQAEKEGMLTEVGEDLKRDITRFQAAERQLGYGELTHIGAGEMAGLARRYADNYGELFSRAQEDGDEIAFVTAPAGRNKDSAAAMKKALQNRYPDLKVAKDAVSNRTLVTRANPSPIGRQHLRKIKRIDDVDIATNNILANIFKPEFIDRINNPTAVAIDMYRVYWRAPGLRAETGVTFEEYVDEADAEVMSEEQSAEDFYRHGAGIRGEDVSYAGARPLLRDFMKRLNQRVRGGNTAAVFRTADGETMKKFTALTQLRSANQQEPEGGIFSKESNPWRAYISGPIAGSVEWVAYRNDQGKILLTLRLNEKPSRFSKACSPTEPDGPWYTLEEIRSCINSPGGFV